MAQTYVLHERNVDDVIDFIEYLVQVRELLMVQFESAEEAILKRGLWYFLLMISRLVRSGVMKVLRFIIILTATLHKKFITIFQSWRSITKIK